ncbi:class II aldolase/adducin family protein [Ruania albidiflava]|uniref:class II aldolase/adducin family protein n=1 Tax=Ruania albidiflava TaxID=366586 RepID=UPI0003B3AF13|nr:class II aldolase/adducin family protein [Ruania albidiflava]
MGASSESVRRAEVAELVDTGADAVRRGLVTASGGNLSVRSTDGTFTVTSSGALLDRLDETLFTVMSLEGEVLAGNRAPSSEWKLHQRIYAARPESVAVLHFHPQHAVLVDALGYPIRMFTLDHRVYVRSVGIVPFFPNGSDELADSASEEAAEHECIVLRHHGCCVFGESVQAAYRRALNLEEAALATYRALLLGDTTTTFPQDEQVLSHQ